jgi:hypothetical protein
MEKIYLIKELIEDTGFSELDFVLEDDFGIDTEMSCYDIIENKRGRADAYPIKIDDMIKKLEDLKQKGASYVEIDYHCDHIGYDISGFFIRKSTEEESKEFIKIEMDEIEKINRIKALQDEIKKIEKS